MSAAALQGAIGGCLRAARRREGVTLRTVALATGLSVAHLSQLERGGPASVAALHALCVSLGLRLSAVLAAAEADLLEESE